MVGEGGRARELYGKVDGTRRVTRRVLLLRRSRRRRRLR